MNFLILGGTGKTGVFGYKYALEQGHHVTLLVRKASAVEPQPNLTIVEGSVLSEDDVKRAVKVTGSVDAILVFLNSRRASENPWAKFVGPQRLIADGTANAARALRQPNPEKKPRLVVMSAHGTGESRAVAPLLIKFIIDYSNVGETYKDHNAVDAEIEENCGSDVKWTSALAVILGDAGVKPVKTFGPTQKGAGLFITRESCAIWMVDVAAGKYDDQFSNKRVIVSN